MKLISIKSASPARARRRGTAEIELLLVIPLLLAILFITAWELALGQARMSNTYNAQNDAYTQVVAGVGFVLVNDPAPPDGINAVKPALPNRYVLAESLKNVTINGRDHPTLIRTHDRALLLDPAWHYSSWPQTGDWPVLQGWFDAYVWESHAPEVVDALGLKPPGPP